MDGLQWSVTFDWFPLPVAVGVEFSLWLRREPMFVGHLARCQAAHLTLEKWKFHSLCHPIKRYWPFPFIVRKWTHRKANTWPAAKTTVKSRQYGEDFLNRHRRSRWYVWRQVGHGLRRVREQGVWHVVGFGCQVPSQDVWAGVCSMWSEVGFQCCYLTPFLLSSPSHLQPFFLLFFLFFL